MAKAKKGDKEKALAPSGEPVVVDNSRLEEIEERLDKLEARIDDDREDSIHDDVATLEQTMKRLIECLTKFVEEV